ncbi:hypothetical protein E2C01_000319 [Portunus trituberculatus]|uniref:Uncharacterized protein n=1 Tax=Portunus trituberculatus TaxID=210409 RepID=A0A5B7CDS1_PORTR|nr:hypothetical protein [Portunus trituberculatus]
MGLRAGARVWRLAGCAKRRAAGCPHLLHTLQAVQEWSLTCSHSCTIVVRASPNVTLLFLINKSSPSKSYNHVASSETWLMTNDEVLFSGHVYTSLSNVEGVVGEEKVAKVVGE